jgi:hypothetical protein
MPAYCDTRGIAFAALVGFAFEEGTGEFAQSLSALAQTFPIPEMAQNRIGGPEPVVHALAVACKSDEVPCDRVTAQGRTIFCMTKGWSGTKGPRN